MPGDQTSKKMEWDLGSSATTSLFFIDEKNRQEHLMHVPMIEAPTIH